MKVSELIESLLGNTKVGMDTKVAVEIDANDVEIEKVYVDYFGKVCIVAKYEPEAS